MSIEVIRSLLQSNLPPTKHLSYGTAGFRDRHDLPLDSIFVRVGTFATLRSLSVSNSDSVNCIGVMITASHNPEIDNGVKIVDPDGGMMCQSWEHFAEVFANCHELDEINAQCLELIQSALDNSTSGVVIVGRDTRFHSKRLHECVVKGVRALNGIVFDLGEVTTPQLHFVVSRLNTYHDVANLTQEQVDIELNNYYKILLSGYNDLCNSASVGVVGKHHVVLDCSGGVGHPAMVKLMDQFSGDDLTIDFRNTVGSCLVNENCGAEHVQKGQKLPRDIDIKADVGKLLCSFDGDADRIVFHSLLEENKWILLDGDKIGTIISLLLRQELEASGLLEQVSMGVVQTAYANGASTQFLQKHGIHVAMAKTGVKYLHHVALNYDVGVYFEANGHGTVLFSDKFKKLFSEVESSLDVNNSRKALAIRRLNACLRTINQTVGDAISDMLMSLAAMKILDLDTAAWSGLYTDLPSKQIKVAAKNKSMVKCSDDETRVVSPVEVQIELDKYMSTAELGRCFIRPSGTEDVIRVYAEAKTQEAANLLADQCVHVITSMIG